MRRLICEVDNYFDKALDPLIDAGVLQKARGTRPQGDRRSAQGAGRRARAVHAGRCAATFLPDRCRPPTSRSIRCVAFVWRCGDQAARSRRRRHADAAARARGRRGSRRCRTSTRRFRRTGGSPSPDGLTHPATLPGGLRPPARPRRPASASRCRSWRGGELDRKAHQLVAPERVDLDDVAGVPRPDKALESVGASLAGRRSQRSRRPLRGRARAAGPSGSRCLRRRSAPAARVAPSQTRGAGSLPGVPPLSFAFAAGRRFQSMPNSPQQRRRAAARRCRARSRAKNAPQVEPGQLARDRFDAVFRHADAGLAVALPQRAHDVVERDCAAHAQRRDPSASATSEPLT